MRRRSECNSSACQATGQGYSKRMERREWREMDRLKRVLRTAREKVPAKHYVHSFRHAAVTNDCSIRLPGA